MRFPFVPSLCLASVLSGAVVIACSGPDPGEITFKDRKPTSGSTSSGATSSSSSSSRSLRSSLESSTAWLYGPGPGTPSHPLDQLWGTAFVCQLHAEVSRGLLGLRPDERVRLGGAIADKVGTGEFDNFSGGLGHIDGDAVEGGVDQARQRHCRRIDDVSLRRPFDRHSLPGFARRQSQRRARRRACGTAVEKQRKGAVAQFHRRVLIKTLGQILAQVAPRHFDGIDGFAVGRKQVFGQIVAHGRLLEHFLVSRKRENAPDFKFRIFFTRTGIHFARKCSGF